ncbi:PH domain-containing protein [Lysinibacillus sp. NPDC048646]|uniref:PH domain-containing protein n=1 Tax=Lysinibacillus sp. NPDC048646 TaxID=3390574 RepID=UPI003D001864
MVFRSKGDIFLLTLIFLVVVIMGTIPLLPIYKEASLSIIISIFAIFIMSLGFIVWYGTSISYVFCEDYLLIKGGPFKSKIPYQNITKIATTTDGFTGYRISPSDKGLVLFLKSETLDRIKILPNDKIKFITELRKRCPTIQIQKSE